MTEAVKHLRLRYPSPDRFAQDYMLLKDGRLFVSKATAPPGARVEIDLQAPGLEETCILIGRVTVSTDEETSKRDNVPAGMWLDFSEGAIKALASLNLCLRGNGEYCRLLKLSPLEAASSSHRIERVRPETKPKPKSAAERPVAPAASSQPAAASDDAPPASPPAAETAPKPSSPKKKPKPEKKEDSPPPTSSAEAKPEPKPEAVKPKPESAETRPKPEPFVKKTKDARGPDWDLLLKSVHEEEAVPLDGAEEEEAPEEEVSEFEPEGAEEEAEQADEVVVAGPSQAVPARPEEADEADAIFGPSPRKAVEIEWVREAIAAGQEAEEEEAPAPAPVAPPAEKKDLTPAERERMAPVGDLIMDLVKAMLRSGYYDPSHPGAKSAKTGLHEKLLEAIGDATELTITHQDTRERSDVLISGVLDDQVSVRTVVGAGMAEMFVPRLKDYFERKNLVSFSLKREISREHFEGFVDVMSDPTADRGTNEQVGTLLTDALVERGISEVSTVFMDDVLLLEERLPWRVEMAINRLAKDIKVLPLFKGLDPSEIQRLKVRIVQDIIRPLRHPLLLKDIVLNIYVIAKHVKDLDEEELERTVIASFPLAMLLPTSGLILEELGRIKEQEALHPDNQALLHRRRSVTRVLKWVSRRVLEEGTTGSREFLERMYFNQILAFHELPPEVQYRINTIKLAEDVKAKHEAYAEALLAVADEDEAGVLLSCLSRAAPVLIERGEWTTLLAVARGLARAGEEVVAFRDGPPELQGPLLKVFGERFMALVEAYQQADKADLERLEELAALLGPFGVEVLIEVMSLSESRAARKLAVDALVKIGPPALAKVRELLSDPQQLWYLYRNALLILAMSGAAEPDDVKLARKFLHHPNARVREEAMFALVRLQGRAAEPVLLAALDDPDRRLVRRALSSLSMIHPLSESGVRGLIAKIKLEPGKTPQDLEAEHKSAGVIRALAAIPDPPLSAEIEKTIMKAIGERWKKKGGLFKRLLRVVEEEEDPVVVLAAIDALGKLGTAAALDLLKGLAEDDSQIGVKAAEAMNRLHLRIG